MKAGDKVDIRNNGHWAHGEWGIVSLVRGSTYHVALWGGDDALVFGRDELKKKSETV